MGLATMAIAITLGVYLPAFIFGLTTQDFTIAEPTDLFSAFAAMADLISIIWDLVTLSGLDLDVTLRFGLLIILGLMWTLIAVGQLRGTSQA